MEIVYFGTDVFLTCFTDLLKHHRIRALYTYHNEEDFFFESEIVRIARDHGIPVHYEAVSVEQTKAYFADGVSLYFIAEYDRIIDIPEDLPSFRGVNIHSSALPEGRSYYPIEAAMDMELEQTGVTMHKVKPLLDSGAILAMRRFPITPEMDSIDVYLTCAAYAREMTEEVFSDFDAVWDRAVEQTEKRPYWRRPASDHMVLRHDMDVREAFGVFRKFNGMTEVNLFGKRFFVRSVMSGKASLPAEEIFLSEDLYLYAVTDGHLRLMVKPMRENGGEQR